jgi:hypothetical protein
MALYTEATQAAFVCWMMRVSHSKLINIASRQNAQSPASPHLPKSIKALPHTENLSKKMAMSSSHSLRLRLSSLYIDMKTGNAGVDGEGYF